MHRRNFVRSGFFLGGISPLLGLAPAAASQRGNPPFQVIDAHGHAGHGEALSAPWSTYNDPEVILRHAEEVGIDTTIIFPIENPTYQRANEEIARIVAKYPGKFIGFAKHDPVGEAGQIE